MLTWQRTTVHEGRQRTIFSPELTTGWTKAFLDLHHNSVSTSTQSYLLLPFHRCQTCIAAWRFYLSFLVPLPFNFHEHFHPIPPSSLAILCPYWHLIPRGPKTDSFSLTTPCKISVHLPLRSLSPLLCLFFSIAIVTTCHTFFVKKYFFFTSSPQTRIQAPQGQRLGFIHFHTHVPRIMPWM